MTRRLKGCQLITTDLVQGSTKTTRISRNYPSLSKAQASKYLQCRQRLAVKQGLSTGSLNLSMPKCVLICWNHRTHLRLERMKSSLKSIKGRKCSILHYNKPRLIWAEKQGSLRTLDQSCGQYLKSIIGLQIIFLTTGISSTRMV